MQNPVTAVVPVQPFDSVLTMHACLSIPEILAIICNQLAPNDDLDSIKYQDRASLAALARTSHIFSESALNALWYDLPDVVPLLLCMPSDLLEKRKTPRGYKKLFLRRSIVPTDWSRFDYHAKRVRTLGFSHGIRITTEWAMEIAPDSEVLRALHFSRPLAPLCPSLRHLSWRSIEFYGFLPPEHICSLIGPQLCRLSLKFEKLDLVETSLIRSIPITCPRITHLSIFISMPVSDHVREIIWETVGCCPLVIFWSDLPVSQRALVHLAGMPALQKMALDVSGDDELKSLSLPQCAFPALRDLKLTGKMALPVLQALPSCKVEAIKIDFIATVDEGDFMANFFKVLHERCSHQSLSRVSVYFWPDFDFVQRHPDIYADMLQPLLSFANLQDISIYIKCVSRLDNNFIEAAAKSWPRLRSLKLSFGRWGDHGWGRSNITLSGLASLARHCPDLTSLTIVIDATVVDHVLDMPISNTRLNVLHLGDSLIEDPTPVAAFLSSIFPYLTSIYSWNFAVTDDETEMKKQYHDRWDEVVRQMERKRMDERGNEAEP